MTISGEQYLRALTDRLTDDGCTMTTAQLRPGTVDVARRADFRLRWFATRLHLFTMAIRLPHVDVSTVAGYTEECSQWAKDNKGGLPAGFQTGVAVFPVLIGEHVDAGAHDWARERQRNSFACLARPVVVDLAGRHVSWFDGKPALGRVYASHLITKAEHYFAPPG